MTLLRRWKKCLARICTGNFSQAVYGTQIMDYEISNAHSDPLKWWETTTFSSKSKDQVYRTYVSVRRTGDFLFPVDVVVKFDDGSSATEHWDGQDRWTRFQFDRQAKVASAEIDPQNQVTMDRDLFNNSYTVEGDPRATHKMRNLFVFASEWLSQLLAWLRNCAETRRNGNRSLKERVEWRYRSRRHSWRVRG